MDQKRMHRRDFIASGLGAGTMALGLGLGMRPAGLQAKEAGVDPIEWPLPLPSRALNVAEVRQCAYDRYFEGGCMYGAGAALVEAFRGACLPEDGGPGYTGWDLIPTSMFKYGKGGVMGWGTICGILNGTAAVLSMAGCDSLINEVIGWYTVQPFPLATCEGLVAASGFEALAAIDVPAHTVSDSPLCHISISRFCEAAGITLKDSSPEGANYKQDRCSKICADTAALAAELINARLADESTSVYAVPASFESCLSCHGEIKDQVGKMNCMGCHSTSDVTLVGRTHGQKVPPSKGKQR